MKVGFLTSVPLTIEAFFLDWMRAWSERSWEIHAAAGGPRPAELVATSYTEVRGLTQNPSRSSLTALRSLDEWRNANDLDLVVVNTATASALYRLLPRHRSKTVYFCHGLHFGDRPDTMVDRAFWLAERALLGRTDAGVGLDTERWSRRTTQAHPALPTGTKLVWMGMFSARKRPTDAVRVLDVMRHHHDPDATLTMLGSGPLHDEVKALVTKLGLDPLVTLTGQVDPRPFLAEADVLVHTAEWEGYCRTLMEATYIGLPAVSYDVKGCRDVFGVEAVGRPGDVQTLVRAADRVRSLDTAVEGRPDFSWQAAFQSTHDFLLSVARIDTSPGR